MSDKKSGNPRGKDATSSAESAGGEEGRAAATMNISLAVEVRL